MTSEPARNTPSPAFAVNATTLVRTCNAAGQWSSPRPLGTVTWDGRPLTLTPAQRRELEERREVRFSTDWYARVRLPIQGPARSVASVPVPPFTCLRCGSHRDTTVAGQCDDCN